MTQLYNHELLPEILYLVQLATEQGWAYSPLEDGQICIEVPVGQNIYAITISWDQYVGMYVFGLCTDLICETLEDRWRILDCLNTIHHRGTFGTFNYYQNAARLFWRHQQAVDSYEQVTANQLWSILNIAANNFCFVQLYCQTAQQNNEIDPYELMDFLLQEPVGNT